MNRKNLIRFLKGKDFDLKISLKTFIKWTKWILDFKPHRILKSDPVIKKLLSKGFVYLYGIDK